MEDLALTNHAQAEATTAKADQAALATTRSASEHDSRGKKCPVCTKEAAREEWLELTDALNRFMSGDFQWHACIQWFKYRLAGGTDERRIPRIRPEGGGRKW